MRAWVSAPMSAARSAARFGLWSPNLSPHPHRLSPCLRAARGGFLRSNHHSTVNVVTIADRVRPKFSQGHSGCFRALKFMAIPVKTATSVTTRGTSNSWIDSRRPPFLCHRIIEHASLGSRRAGGRKRDRVAGPIHPQLRRDPATAL